MNYYKIIITNLFLIVAISCISCKKGFLDVSDNSELNRQSYVKDLATMQEFLNGVYIRLQSNVFEHGIGAAYPELTADDLMPLISGTQCLISNYTWSQTSSDKITSFDPKAADLNLNGIWRGHYLIIRACNFVIEDIDKYRDENPIKADDMKGQAYAIRAMVHFKLVNVFAQHYKFTDNAAHSGIPYITTSDVTKPYSRQSVAQVYDELIGDLQKAVSLLVPDATDIRIMNKIAAKGLLARAYLFKEDYTATKNTAVEIINQVPLMTIAAGYPSDIYKNKSPLQTETLFQLRPIKFNTPNVSAYFGNYLRGSSMRYLATDDIATILKENPNDVRQGWVASASGVWNVTKFPTGVANETPSITTANTAYYPAIIRASELYLAAAEASAKTGDEDAARNYLDAIRKRADPLVESVIASGQPLIDSIYKERRKELCFEGLRMYDLQRWKLGVHRVHVHPNYSFAKDLPYPSDKAIAPIPLNDVRLAGLNQNPGYDK